MTHRLAERKCAVQQALYIRISYGETFSVALLPAFVLRHPNLSSEGRFVFTTCMEPDRHNVSPAQAHRFFLQGTRYMGAFGDSTSDLSGNLIEEIAKRLDKERYQELLQGSEESAARKINFGCQTRSLCTPGPAPRCDGHENATPVAVFSNSSLRPRGVKRQGLFPPS